jgi:hypothetical protein
MIFSRHVLLGFLFCTCVATALPLSRRLGYQSANARVSSVDALFGVGTQEWRLESLSRQVQLFFLGRQNARRHESIHEQQENVSGTNAAAERRN